eukprot:4239427-Prorocentrum_lima.AAC.1
MFFEEPGHNHPFQNLAEFLPAWPLLAHHAQNLSCSLLPNRGLQVRALRLQEQYAGILEGHRAGLRHAALVTGQ